MNEPSPPGSNIHDADIPPAGSVEARIASTVLAPTPAERVGSSTGAGVVGLPEQFGRYRIHRQLGRGGMGTVFLAHDTKIDRPVALKVPHPEVAQDPHALERFYREARSAGKLRHANICPVYDVDAIDGTPYLTMAYIEGQPLSNLMTNYPGQPRQTAALVRTVALALQHAHELGVVHRDLKPANIMMTPRGEPVVMDFGLARQVRSDASQSSQGVILGTPAYMPPEQASGDSAASGPRADVYSLGVILYELVTGRIPFRGTTTSVLVQILHDRPPPPSRLRPDLDPRLEAICLCAMAREPERRFPGMAGFAAALEAWLSGAAGSSTAALGPAPSALPQSQAVEEALVLLRTWGWHRGLRLAREKLDSSTEGGARETLTRLLDYLTGTPGPQDGIVAQMPVLRGWQLVGKGYQALLAFDYDLAQRCLDEGIGQAIGAVPPEWALEAHRAYQRGYLLTRRGRWQEAVAPLTQALTLFGRDHFLTGRVLDALGRVYAGKCNHHAAIEFHRQAILCKQNVNDEEGLVLSYEELGRLHVEIGQLDRAEELLQAGLRLSQKNQDEGAEAQLFNHLGRVAMARAEREETAGKHTHARKLLAQAAEYLDASIAYNAAHRRQVQEGRTHKDRALLCLAERNPDGAEEHLLKALALLEPIRFARGMAEVRRVLGVLRRSQGRHDEAAKVLRLALTHYDDTHECANGARTQLELARTIQSAGGSQRVITQAFLDALDRAETCRRSDLVRIIEEELQTVNEEAQWRHVQQRLRGRGAPEDTTSLETGTSEPATVLFFNLQGFIPYCQGMDPEDVMLTLNQMLADLMVALERHRAYVTTYLGGGFMALLREANHAQRGVQAALDLVKVVEEFNRPREVLGLRLLPARIGIASGGVFVGNIGTYHKMEFTAVGAPVNLAARLMRQGDVNAPCISRETRELLRDDFVFREGCPRVLDLPGIGRREVWDVAGRKVDEKTTR
jgi:class 3 adenylate cyclase/tetratricopeptide (TPR) repeat protein